MQYRLRTLLIVMAVVPPLVFVLVTWPVRVAQVLAVAMIIFGGVSAVGIGAWHVFHAVRQILYWPKATATVLRYWITRSEGKADGQRFYHPVLRYRIGDDRDVIAISPSGHWRKTWRRGDSLVVRYDPKNPRWIEIASLWNLWGVPLIVFGLPLGFSLLHFWLK